MRRTCRYLLLCLLGLLGSACSVTRHIPDGEYLLQSVRIENDRSTPRKVRIPKEELAKYIRQQPNKRMLGTNFYIWLYEQADSTKHNGWNNWKRRVGQEPVLLNMSYTERSARNLKSYMDSKGYYASEATFEVDTLSRRKRARVTYRTRQGAPYRIADIGYEFRDRALEPLVLADTLRTLLHTGDIFDIERLDAERERITAYLRNLGYYDFSVGNIEYVADTLGGDRRVGLKMVVKERLEGYDRAGKPRYADNRVYRFGTIAIHPDYNPTAAVRRGDADSLRADTVIRDGLRIRASHYFTLPWDPRATDGSVWPETGGLILQLAPMDYIVAGSGIVLTFDPADSAADSAPAARLGEDGFLLTGSDTATPDVQTKTSAQKRVGLASVEEVSVTPDGTLTRLRTLNGDETHQGRHVRIGVDGFRILHVTLYSY